MLCQEQCEIYHSLFYWSVCHGFTIRISDWWISHQTGMKSPLKEQTEDRIKCLGMKGCTCSLRIIIGV